MHYNYIGCVSMKTEKHIFIRYYTCKHTRIIYAIVIADYFYTLHSLVTAKIWIRYGNIN